MIAAALIGLMIMAHWVIADYDASLRHRITLRAIDEAKREILKSIEEKKDL